MVKHVFSALLLALVGADIAATPVFAQGKFKEERLEDLPAVDTERSSRSAVRTTPRTSPSPLREATPPEHATDTPPPAAETRRPGRLRIETYRNHPAAPPEHEEEVAPPAREAAPTPRRDVVAPTPPSRNADFLPPVPTRESDAARRRTVAAPVDVPVTTVPAPARDTRGGQERRAAPPPSRSTAFAGCTNRCLANCEMEFEQCNGGASPARSSCVRQLESCRPERCGCKMF